MTEISVSKKLQINRDSDIKLDKNKKPFDEAHMHDGHRARLLDTLYNVGIENVSDVQAMEFILFYIFPRGDVNPLAHRLLHEFGTVANVLDADINSLKEIRGMGERSAKSLKLLGDLFFYYTQNKLSDKIVLSNLNQITDFFEELLRFEPKEKFLIIGLDPNYKLIQKKVVAIGSVKNVGITPSAITNFVASCCPTSVIFAHNHPGGKSSASSQDVEATDRLEKLLVCLGVKFIDHFIIGNDGIFSVKSKGRLRNFN